jgi:hypothetical protein
LESNEVERKFADGEKNPSAIDKVNDTRRLKSRTDAMYFDVSSSVVGRISKVCVGTFYNCGRGINAVRSLQTLCENTEEQNHRNRNASSPPSCPRANPKPKYVWRKAEDYIKCSKEQWAVKRTQCMGI